MSNIFQKVIGEGFSSFFHKKKDESVIGIDVGSSSIKVVQLKKKDGKAVLETYGALALGPYVEAAIGSVTNLPADKLTQSLLDVIKESNVTTKSGALAIPSSASLIFLITLPGTIPESELASVIPTEARKYIPVPVSEVSLDWWIIPREAESVDESMSSSGGTLPEAKTEVLVVAIHNDTLTRYRDLLTASEINSTFFEMEVFSSVRSTFGRELTPVLLMDFGASKTKLSIVEHGVVRVFHIVNRGSADITTNISQSLNIGFKEAEDLKRETGLDTNANATVADVVKLSVDYIMAETSSIVLAYEKKYNKAISKVILTGGGSLLRGLFERVAQNFTVEVVYGDPFGKTNAPEFLNPILSTSGPEFAVAIGIALRELS